MDGITQTASPSPAIASKVEALLEARRAHAAAITSLSAAADGTLVSSSEDGRVVRWAGERGELVATADDFVSSLAADGAGRVCAGYDGAIRRL